MTITAYSEHSTLIVDSFLEAAIKSIDDQFGDGFAKANPALVGAYISASATDFAAAKQVKALRLVADQVCEALKKSASPE